MFPCQVLFLTDYKLTCKQFDRQTVGAASASHLHHREDAQQCAQARTLFLMKYNWGSTLTEDTLWYNPLYSYRPAKTQYVWAQQMLLCSQFLAPLLKCFLSCMHFLRPYFQFCCSLCLSLTCCLLTEETWVHMVKQYPGKSRQSSMLSAPLWAVQIHSSHTEQVLFSPWFFNLP